MNENPAARSVASQIEALKARMLKKSYHVMFRQVRDRALVVPQIVLDHYEWIIQLEKNGLVFLSGPLFDVDGAAGVGMTVFRCSDPSEALELAATDPFVKCGAMTFEIKRWQVNEGRVSLCVDFSDQTFHLE